MKRGQGAPTSATQVPERGIGAEGSGFGDLPPDSALFDRAVMPLQLEKFLASKNSTYQPGLVA
jgi:hypothetical protein